MYTFREFCISDRMMDGINRYVNDGRKPGRFLTAIICNDLQKAVGQADDNNLPNIPAFVSYFYNETPGVCWGSEKKMIAWMACKRKAKNIIKMELTKIEGVGKTTVLNICEEALIKEGYLVDINDAYHTCIITKGTETNKEEESC